MGVRQLGVGGWWSPALVSPINIGRAPKSQAVAFPDLLDLDDPAVETPSHRLLRVLPPLCRRACGATMSFGPRTPSCSLQPIDISSPPRIASVGEGGHALSRDEP